MFFAIATPGFVCFGAHLTSDWSAFWVNFAGFLALVRKPIQGIRMAHEAVQKLQFPSFFHAFLTREKSSSSQRLVDFLEKHTKVQSQKNDTFSGHLYSGIACFIFSRDLEKNVIPETICGLR